MPNGPMTVSWAKNAARSRHSRRRWVLDPVDGTRAFITGRHEWGTLIALEENGAPVLGIIDQPVLGERFIGANGEAELHHADGVDALNVRPCASLSDAVLCATHPWRYFSAPARRVSSASRRAPHDRYSAAIATSMRCSRWASST